MKTRLTVLILLICFYHLSYGQAPGRFNYQAVARNTAGNLIINQNISVRVSILTGSVTGSSEYTETHSVTTDAYGVFNLLVGGGSVVSGTFSSITWGSASKFLKIEADVTGGTTYQAIATTQILSAPYALYANESGTKTFNDSEFSIIYAGGVADNPLTAPTAALGGLGAGSIENGTHDYKVTFITSAGETGAGPASGLVTVSNNTSNGKILVSGIPVSNKTNVSGRNLYRRFNSAGDYKLLTSIADNSTTTYIDNIGNASLGKVLPVSNSTTNSVKFDASGLTYGQIVKIPNSSGTLVLNKESSVSIQSKTDRSLTLHGRNVIQSLINGAYTFGANSGEFAEAFITANGRNNSVNIDLSATESAFNVNKYEPYDFTSPNMVYIDIYASSVDQAILTEKLNNLICVKVSQNIWRLYSWKNSLSEATNRLFVKLFANLPNGATNPNGVTGLTELRISDNKFRNKKIIYSSMSGVAQIEPANTQSIIWSLSETDNNIAYIIDDWTCSGVYGTREYSYYFPISTRIHYQPMGAAGSSNFETGTINSVSAFDGVKMTAYSSKIGGSYPYYGCSFRNIMIFSSNLNCTVTSTGPSLVSYTTSGSFILSNTPPDPVNNSYVSTISIIIPPGTFTSNISKICGIPLFASWETDDDIQFKLTNGSDDTGWLKHDEPCSFDPFLSEPTGLIIKMIPKSVSPSPSSPSLYGFYLTEF